MSELNATGSFGTKSAQFRGHLVYSVSSSSTSTTISYTLYLQGHDNYGYDFTTSLSGGPRKSLSGKFSSNPGSSWTTIKSGSGTYSWNRGTSAATKTITLKATGPEAGKYSGTQTVTKTASISVPALPSYTINYNGNGATSGSMTASTKYYGTNLTLKSNAYSKTGYSFMGWGTSASTTTASYANGGTYTANSGTTLYAIWRKTITLSYNLNGGTSSTAIAAQTGYAYNSATSTTFAVTQIVPTRQNYNFLGWSTNSGATVPDYLPGATTSAISANTTLYAVWEQAYTIPEIDASGVLTTRVDNTDTEQDEGTYLHMYMPFKINKEYGIGVDSVEVWARTTDAADSDPWTMVATTNVVADTYQLPMPTLDADFNGTVDQGPIPFGAGTYALDKSYNIRMRVTDLTGNTYVNNNYGEYTDTLSTAFFTMDFLAGGHGVAIGAPHSGTQDQFEVAMDTKFYVGAALETTSGTTSIDSARTDTNIGVGIGVGSGGATAGLRYYSDYANSTATWLIHRNGANTYIDETLLADFVTSRGKNGEWYYRKWKSGTVEAWCPSHSFGSQTGTAWGNVYIVELNLAIPAGIFPTGSTPHVILSGTGRQWWVVGYSSASATQISTIRFVRPASSASTPYVGAYCYYMP